MNTLNELQPQAPAQPTTSIASKLIRVVGFGFGAVVAVFFVLVAIGYFFGQTEPLAQVEGGDVVAIIPVDDVDHDEFWFVVVDPGTSVGDVQAIAEQLLELPEAEGRRIEFTFHDDDADLQEYIEFTEALTGDFDELDIDRALELASAFDVDLILENTVAHVNWSPGNELYLVCASDAVCTVDSAVSSFSG